MKINFDKKLKPPLPEDGYPFFNQTDHGFIYVNFTAKVEQEDGDAQKFSYRPLEFDPEGSWMKVQLTFSKPLLISSGDFADEIDVYVFKDYFLRAWYPA